MALTGLVSYGAGETHEDWEVAIHYKAKPRSHIHLSYIPLESMPIYNIIPSTIITS